MANLHSKNDSNYKKYIEPGYESGMESINGSRQLKFENVPGIKEPTFKANLKNSAANRQALEQFREEAFKRWKGGKARDEIVVETDKGTFQYSRLSTEDARTGQGFNKGDTSEGLLAVGMAARMISKTKKISKNDIVKILKNLKAVESGKTSTAKKTFKSANANPKIHDTIILDIGLAPKNMNALLNPKIIDGFFDDLMMSVLDYANNGRVKRWADLLYNNNRSDIVEIKSDGIGGQTTTKVDLFVNVNGKRVNLNISLKAGDAPQFGQLAGADIETMKDLWGPMGVKFGSSEVAKFDSFLMSNSLTSHEKPIAAINYAYQEAAKQINEMARRDRTLFIRNLSDFINRHATYNDDSVQLVQLNKKQAQIYTFKNLFPAVQQDGKQLIATVEGQKIGDEAAKLLPSKPTLPRLMIHPSDSKPGYHLLMIRSKIEKKGGDKPFYHRNTLNKGKYVTDLIAKRPRQGTQL